MSVRVLSQVFRHSRSTLAARLVLLVLADAAHDDGIAWPTQDVLAAKAAVGVSTVRRVLEELEALGEVETRKAQRGRRRVNVYRVTLATEEPRYGDLPFALKEPFGTTAQSERSSADDDRSSTPVTTAQSERSHARAPMEVRTVRENRKQEASPPVARTRKRDVVFDAMADATDSDPHLEGALIGKAIAQLRKHPDYLLLAQMDGRETADARLAEEIPLRRQGYAERFGPDVECTPLALVKHWRRAATTRERPKAKDEKWEAFMDEMYPHRKEGR